MLPKPKKSLRSKASDNGDPDTHSYHYMPQLSRSSDLGNHVSGRIEPEITIKNYSEPKDCT